jgi:hypothetical protein
LPTAIFVIRDRKRQFPRNIGSWMVLPVIGVVAQQERLMKKLAVRILMLSMFATSLLVAPVVTGASAATSSSKHVKKKVHVTHQSPKAANPYASPYSSNPYENDFDRRNAGGGGGY